MKKIHLTLLILMFVTSLVGCKPIESEETPVAFKNYQITPYFTKGDKSQLLSEQTTSQTEEGLEALYTKVTLDSSVTYQTMDGFGAAMTESSAYLIKNLDVEKQELIMQDLFGEEGINIGFVRIPMGASDFALSNYSYNDLEDGQTDLDMEHFTLERDEQYVIPMLQMAKQVNEDILFLGSPWSAPAWMKTTNTMNGGSIKNEYLDAYVKYFVKFIQGYQEKGLDIYAVTPQNEPLHQTTNYPTMYMNSQQQLSFVIKMNQAFQEANIDSLIITYDHNWDQPNYPMSILASENGYDAVDGSGFHCYGGQVSAQAQVAENYPDKGIWFTECSGGGWATNFASNMAWNIENVFIGSINYFAKGVLMWNLALDDNDGPTNGGCMNCRGVITIHEDGTYTRNEEYYFIGHFSKFVNRGAERIKLESSRTDLIATAFKNPNGELVVVMHNKSRSTFTYTLSIDGSNVNLSIPASTTATYVITEGL
jgi:glucosylceramidase